MGHIYLSLGSNIGDRRGYLERAKMALREAGCAIEKSSAIYESEAWGNTGLDPFLNCCVEISCDLEPEGLLCCLKLIEQRLGRQDRGTWGAREIDIDILLYRGMIRESASLVIPHPLMHQRRFVLEPLAEIASDVRHPCVKRTMAELLNEVGDALIRKV